MLQNISEQVELSGTQMTFHMFWEQLQLSPLPCNFHPSASLPKKSAGSSVLEKSSGPGTAVIGERCRLSQLMATPKWGMKLWEDEGINNKSHFHLRHRNIIVSYNSVLESVTFTRQLAGAQSEAGHLLSVSFFRMRVDKRRVLILNEASLRSCGALKFSWSRARAPLHA